MVTGLEEFWRKLHRLGQACLLDDVRLAPHGGVEAETWAISMQWANALNRFAIVAAVGLS
jgi:hypothetical protein